MPKPKRIGVTRKVVTYDTKLSVERTGNSTHCVISAGFRSGYSRGSKSREMDFDDDGRRGHRQCGLRVENKVNNIETPGII